MSEELRVKLLGPPAAFVGEEPVSGFVSVKAQALLFYLAATGETHRRDALASLLWSDVPDAAARKNLRDVLSNLRQLVGPFLLITRQEVGLNPDAPAIIDSQVLSGTLSAVRDANVGHPVNALQSLAEIADPRMGEFLDGFYAPDAPLFEEWMLAERTRLQWELGNALERLAEYSLAAGDYAGAEAYARRQMELDSYREEAHRQLMAALALSDRRAEAVAHYEDLVDLLWRELGLEPAKKTQELMAQIQTGEPITPVLAGVPQVPPDNLPQALTPFIGRESELAVIASQLETENCRLLTLHGPGGAGKTRLALEFACRRRGQFADGIFFVPLASVTSPENLVFAIAGAVGLQIMPGREPRQQLQRYLKNRRMLLLLDNFEHLKEGALLLVDMLQAALHLTIMVTSRERLWLAAESLFEVRGLRTDADNGRIGSRTASKVPEAVQMFETYARRVRPGFQPDEDERTAVVDLCRLVEGMPLAIELASVWVFILSPPVILQQIAAGSRLLETEYVDLPPRLRSVRASFNYSWGLLGKDEQQALMRLSVFRGGCSRASAETVAGATAEILAALVDKSMVTCDPSDDRYQIHELIRQLTEERLWESGAKRQVQNGHLDYYLRLTERMSPGYMEYGQLDLFRKTDAEMDNIKTAFEWAVASEQVEKAARLLTAINYYLRYQTRYLVEGYRLNKRLLPYVEQLAPINRVSFLVGASELAFRNGEIDHFHRFARRALRSARDTCEDDLIAWSLTQMIDYSDDAKANEQAIKYGEEGLTLFRELGNKPGMAYTLNRLGEIYRLCGDLDQAKKVYEESLALCQETGEVIREDMNKINLALIAYLEGNLGLSYNLHMSVIRQEYILEWKHHALNSFAELSGILARLGEPVKAARILGACYKLMFDLGIDYHAYEQSIIELSMADTESLLDESVFEEEWTKGQNMTYAQLIAYVLGGPGGRKTQVDR